jgi:hypothetical protein
MTVDNLRLVEIMDDPKEAKEYGVESLRGGRNATSRAAY